MARAETEDKNKNYLVLLFPEDQTDAPELEREILKHNDCSVETIITTPALLERLAAKEVTGLFCSVRVFDVPLLNILSKAQGLRRHLYSAVLSESIEKRAQEFLKRLDRVAHLEKPLSLKSIVLICEKLVQGNAIFERKHRRYATQQAAIVEVLSNQVILKGTVFNLSQGGAYMELDSGEIAAKEIVRLILQLDKLGKNRVMNARVAWTIKPGFNSQRFGLGLEFINSTDDYISLLERG